MSSNESTNVHPGVLLQRDLDAFRVTRSELARRLGETYTHIDELCDGRRPMTPELAKKLQSTLGGRNPDYWMAAQREYDWDQVAKEAGGHERAVVWLPTELVAAVSIPTAGYLEIAVRVPVGSTDQDAIDAAIARYDAGEWSEENHHWETRESAPVSAEIEVNWASDSPKEG